MFAKNVIVTGGAIARELQLAAAAPQLDPVGARRVVNARGHSVCAQAQALHVPLGEERFTAFERFVAGCLAELGTGGGFVLWFRFHNKRGNKDEPVVGAHADGS